MSCADAGNFKLYFNSVSYGEFVTALLIVPRLVEEVRERHNLWSSSALLDCGYPALIWEYKVSLYILGTDRLDLISDFVGLTTIYSVGLANLQLTKDESTTPMRIDCNTCCLAEISGISQPEDFLIGAAGVFNLRFLGTSIPTTTVSTVSTV